MKPFVQYVIKRLLFIVPILLGVSFGTFMMLYLMPGDPAVIILGPSATSETIEIMRKFLGLDQPLYVQYFAYMNNLIHGNLGRSIVTGGSVLSLLADRFVNTAELAIVSMIFSASLGIMWNASQRPTRRSLTIR
jgi:ABC-type dipeptide/oligopeptide/nickel transport system permease component